MLARNPTAHTMSRYACILFIVIIAKAVENLTDRLVHAIVSTFIIVMACALLLMVVVVFYVIKEVVRNNLNGHKS